MATLYGLGVGPGDPELMTLKTVRLIKESDIIAIPQSGQDVNTAYAIAKKAVPQIEEKEIARIAMPMTRDQQALDASHDAAARRIIDYLDHGQNVAFLTLGDPSIYSTYTYIHKRVLASGRQAQMVPGIPSFCAVSARLNEPLAEAGQALHIIPASYKALDTCMELEGTKVLMKSGKAVGEIKDMICGQPHRWSAKMVERCGMEGERAFHSADEINPQAGYFSIIVVKDK